MHRVSVAVALSVLASATLCVACGSSSLGGGSAAQAVASHAGEAGIVMTRGQRPISARSAAALVVGSRGDTRIDALQADGTTYRGSVILRISVEQNSGLVSHQQSTECFDYRFRHRLDDHVPHPRPSCPSSAPLSLRPSTAPGVSARTVRAVRRAVAALPAAQRVRVTPVRQAVVAALGPGYTVIAQPQAGGVQVRVTSGNQCMTATVASGGAVHTSTPMNGTDCAGG
ncbi:MAG TPA: hypothetical protein VFE19_13245 [Jatrophihabitantaceae bacterium]|jgi:hypothetical protein|nr:hypothetical protein [Jatrophihabitantaceae bacterium]